MKTKSILLFLFIFLLLTGLAEAAINTEEIEQKIDSGKEKIENYTNPETQSEFLKKEWRSFLVSSSIGKVFVSISDQVEKLNPVIEKLIGIPYGINWAFLFAFIIWLAILLFIARPASAALNNGWAGFLSGLIVASIFGVSGLIKKLVDLISMLINNIWVAIISVVIAIILLLLLERIGLKIKKIVQKMKENSEKEKEKENRETLDMHAKAVEKVFKENNIVGPTNTKVDTYYS